MKTLNKIIFIIILFFALSGIAQSPVTGTIANWSGAEAVIASEDFLTGDLINWGTVTAQGDASLLLDDDFLSLLKEQAEKAKKNAPKGWTLKFKTVASTFSSGSDYFPGEFVYENGEAMVSGVPELMVGREAGQEKLGVLYMADSQEMAKWLYEYRVGNVTPGYYVNHYYVEKDATVKGQVLMPSATQEGEEYDHITLIDMQLEQGWNAIKYEIAEVFTSQAGNTYPSKTIISRENALPADLQWILLAE